MKAFGIFLVLLLCCAFSAIADAVVVTDSNCIVGTNTLSSLLVDNNGNIAITCTTPSVGTCTGYTYAWGACISGSQTQTVSGYLPSGCTGTPIIASAPATQDCPIPGSGAGVCASNAMVLPSTGVGMCSTEKCGVAIGSLGSANYTFTLPTASIKQVVVSETTNDWTTESDVLVSNVSQPACTGENGKNVPPKAAPWYNTASSSNQNVGLMEAYPAGTTFCVTICNRSGVPSYIGLFWSEL